MEEPQKTNNKILKFIIIIAIIGLIIFGITTTINHFSNPTNNDGNNLTNRSANNSDIQLKNGDFLNFKITPKNDITNLEITFQFLDNSKNLITTKTKNIGNVKKDIEYSISFNLSDFSFTETLKLTSYYTKYTVTGGTVSYFK